MHIPFYPEQPRVHCEKCCSAISDRVRSLPFPNADRVCTGPRFKDRKHVDLSLCSLIDFSLG